MTDNLYELTEEERKERGIESLPGSLGEAIAAAENSELVRETLGDHAFERLIWNKKQEWAEFRSQVTQWELNKYLPVL
jgi:glutamine synthetase